MATPPYAGYLSPEDQLKQAQAIVAAALLPQQQATARAQAEAGLAAASRGATAEGLSKALAGELGGIAPQIQADYQQAGADTSAYAKGYSDTMRQLLGADADKTNSILRQQGAPEGQMVKPSAAPDVLYGVEGSLPGQELTKAGAGFTAAARLLPGTALLRGQQDVGAAAAQGAAEQANYRGQAADIAAQAPGLLASQLSNFQQQQAQLQSAGEGRQLDIRQMNMQNEQFRSQLEQSARQFNANMAEQRRQYNVARGDRKAEIAAQMKHDTAQFNATQKLNWASYRVNKQYLDNALRKGGADITGVDPATGNLLPGYTQAPDGTVLPPGYTLGPQGQAVPPGYVAAPDGSVTKPTKVPASQTPQAKHAAAVKARANALADARSTILSLGQKYLGTPVENKLGVGGPYLDPTGRPTNDENAAARTGARNFAEASNLIYVAVADDLRRYGIKPGQIRTEIRKRLVALGFEPPAAKAKAAPGVNWIPPGVSAGRFLG